MPNQPNNQPQQPPIGYYTLMGTIGVCLAAVIVYLAISYFAK